MVRYKSDHRILSENNEAASLAYLPTKLASSPLVKAVISHRALTNCSHLNCPAYSCRPPP